MTTTNKPLTAEKAIAQAQAAQAQSKLEQAKAEVKKAETSVDDVSGAAAAVARVKAFDAASARLFDARLDEAAARLAAWKAKAAEKRAERSMKGHDALASLEEKIALARARAADAKHAKYADKARAAFEDAARHFDEAYDAAAKRYGA